MRAPVSVIIPTLNAAQALQDALPALAEGLSSGLVRELVISDGGSEDATLQIAEDAGAILRSGAPGRGSQLRRGADAANGDWLLFLHADTVLPPGWSNVVLGHLPDTGRAAYFRLAFDAEGVAPHLVAAWANIRSRGLGLPYGDQGLLISAELYAEIGGYRDIPLMEDVAMAHALKGKLKQFPVAATTSAGKYLRDGWVRRGTRNLITLGRYLVGVDPIKLAEAYDRQAR